jgi:hydrophobic/amphiphilic exporter-1 (mainly G- bacteria), HAE1 family
LAQFFINRPIVAIVIAILTVLLGVFSLTGLSIEQYPFLAPPTIRVTATYPGASAVAVEQSVATPVEQEVNGVESMIFMQSSNTSDGRMLLDVNFKVGVDQDKANVLTQNRVTSAQARLPQEVNAQGVTVKKQSPSILMLISVYSPAGAYDANYLINYCGINLRDQLLRIPGIAQVDLFGGTDYGMRIWLRPDRLAKLGLTPADVITSIREQNLLAPAGRIGAAPSPKDQQFTYTVSAPGRLVLPSEFENIIIRGTEAAAQVRIRDVGRAELGSQDYNSFGRLDGKPAGTMAVYLLPGANQLQASKAIYDTMTRAKGLFPPDMDYKIVYDTTPAVEASIEGIVHTFVEAIILVTLVVFIFLQSVRATIIPLLTVPVSLIGTFLFFPLLGFSVNTLSMFGLVLAIGIVVDDAIVVVEAVMHHIEHGLAPREATIQAMKEVSAPVIGIALILSAVFIPVAFVGGLTGQMYQQFALTIAISVLLSAFSALSLAPALSVMMLKPASGPMRGPLGKFFGLFNRGFDRATNGYIHVTRLLVRRAVLTIVLVVVVAVGAGLFGRALPAGFIPEEDQGILGVNVQLPPAASLERTGAVLTQVEQIVAKTAGVESFSTIGGFGVVTNTYQPNFGTIFVRLKPWDERHGPALHAKGIMASLQQQVSKIPEAIIFPFNIPTISGFGASAGFKFLLQDRSGTLSVQELGAQTGKYLAAARQRPELGNLFTSFDPNYPQVKVELDREKARSLGVPVNEVFQAMSAAMGGTYVNDFNRFGRLFRVYVQAEADYRRKPRDIGDIYVRSVTGTMIPLSTLVTISSEVGTEITTRFNLFRSVEISGAPARGYTSGQALAALEDVFAQNMPKEMGFAYSGLSYQEKVAPPAGPTFVLAIVFVFLLLAAMYESWRLPWAVLLGSPLVALGAFFGVWLMGYDNNVYVQVGLIMLVGLAAKNAILIVEFAKAKHDAGESPQEAALEAARLRFRPILMTAFAFILGVVPLMLASGAGSGAQNVMGTAVFWGMLVATALGVFLIPGNFAFVEGLGRSKTKRPAPAPAPHTGVALGEQGHP